MKAAGIGTLVVGVLALIVAFLMETSVHSYSSYSGSSDIINIGLLQNQLMVWQLGLALIVTGGVLIAVGNLHEALRAGGVVPSAEEASEQASSSGTCEWCGVAFQAPLHPCSSIPRDLFTNPSTVVTLERCHEELTARGIEFNRP